MGTNDTYNSASTRHTQEQRIIALLHAAWPNWVPATSLSKISLQYSARIHSLRHKHHWQIESKVEVINGVRHGSFRLARPFTYPNPTRKKTVTAPKAEGPVEDNATLFPATERHLDLG